MCDDQPMGATAATRPLAATELMPPGPRLPRVLQTAGFIVGGPRFLEACRRRYGDAVTFGTLFDERFVMVYDPALVKQLFQGSGEQLHAGEANALLGPVVGERSVLLLDGGEHLRHRRLMLPAFHGAALQRCEEVIVRAADAEIDSWPVGSEFPLLPSMQALTLRVILRAVFGYEPGAAEEELARRLRAFVEPLGEPRSIRMLVALVRRGDVFSSLLLARDEQGERLTDEEVRDELLTLLIAGHETTATGLAWAFDLLLHAPEALARARAGLADDAYLDAVAKESLRLRPVIPGVGRVVRGEPFRLGDWVIPPGVEINPSIRVIHRRADLYPEPRRFRPERFLAADAPDTYTWVPFGGGTRRCLGASFALLEMRLVLRRVLARAPALRAADPRRDRIQFRAITLVPRSGTRVLLGAPAQPR